MSMSSGLSALVILAAAVITYGLMMVVDGVRSHRRQRQRGSRKGSQQWRKRLPVALVVATVASLAFALAQVQLNRQVSSGTVVLAIDVSHSMSSTDVQPNRLAAAKVAAEGFLERLPADFRVGLVTFSVESAVPIAPTADRAQVSRELTSLAIATSTGTVIGDGLSAALDAIEADRGPDESRPAAVVLLSDGLDSGSTIPPDEAAARALQLGVPVYTVAIGQAPSGASESDATGTGGDLLSRIAEKTDAKTYSTDTAGELTQVYATLGSRLSYELAIDSRAGPFVIAAVVMTLIAAAVTLSNPRDPYAQGTKRKAKQVPKRTPGR
ncbi:MAG: VWA domain-containing protein [Actinomycetota bacterium]